MPRVNLLLLIGVLLLATAFRSSGALASAYGIAVTGTMVVTAAMALVVIWKDWRWPLWAAAALMVPFLLVDTTFLSANLLKVVHGGWVPLLIAALLITIMVTWRKGVSILYAKTRRLETPLQSVLEMLEKSPPKRVPGTAMFLTATPDNCPTALLHSLKHYKVLHEKNVNACQQPKLQIKCESVAQA
jgi:KUP system potassium uptake protein